MPSQEEYLDSLLKDLNLDEKTGKQAANEQLEEAPAAEVQKVEAASAKKRDSNDNLQYGTDDIEALLQAAEEIHGELKPSEMMAGVDKNTPPVPDDLHDFSEEDIDRLLAAGSGREAEPGGKDISATDMAGESPEQEDFSGAETKKQERRARRDARRAQRKAIKEAKKAKKSDKKKAGEEEFAFVEPADSNEPEEELEHQDFEELDNLLETGENSGNPETKEQPEETPETDSLFAGLAGLENLNIWDSENAEAGDKAGSLSGDILDGTDAEELFNIPELDEEELKKDIEPKKGFWKKLLDFLTEEEDDEEDEEAQLSSEKKDSTDKERAGKKSRKHAKKKRNIEQTEEGGEDSESKKERLKARKQKKKDEKEKAAAEEEPLEHERKLSFKKIIPIALVCFSIMAAVIILANASAGFMSKREGRRAYYEGDYQTCFQNLYGKALNESEEVMFHKSESILRISLRISEYELFEAEGSEVEALDVLIQAVQDYPSLYEYASQWNAAQEVSESYAQILQILSQKYNLTEEQAKEIGALPDDVEYTRTVTDIANGQNYAGQAEQRAALEEAVQMEDRLPEEEEISEENFLDNNGQ